MDKTTALILSAVLFVFGLFLADIATAATITPPTQYENDDILPETDIIKFVICGSESGKTECIVSFETKEKWFDENQYSATVTDFRLRTVTKNNIISDWSDVWVRVVVIPDLRKPKPGSISGGGGV